MNAQQARDFAKAQIKQLEEAEKVTLHGVMADIEKAIREDPTREQIMINYPSARVVMSLQAQKYETQEYRDRDGEKFLIINWSMEGIVNRPGTNLANEYYGK